MRMSPLLIAIQDLSRRAIAPRGSSEGQGLAEYALLLALIAIVAIASLLFLGSQISSTLSEIGIAV